MTTEKFNLLPKKEKAVLVAKDVLKQLKAGKYIANSGSYVNYELEDDKLLKENKDIKKNFDKVKSCHVCAIGSLLMSCTHLGNLLTFQDLEPNSGALERVNHYKIAKLFKSIFTGKTLLRIEYAFEGEDGNKYAEDHLGQEVLNEKEIYLLQKFCDNYFEERLRLTAICENIITNKGTFKL